MVSGWGYYYLPRIRMIFSISIALMLIILYLSLGQRSSWWAPILTGIVLRHLGPRVRQSDGLQLRPRDAGYPVHP